MIKVTIGLPSNGFIRTETTVSLVTAVANTKGIYFRLANPTGCYIHQNRELIALEALKENSTHLLFVDADMGFPENAIAKLISRNKPIIGANYNYRNNQGKSVIQLDTTKFKDGEVNVHDNPKNKGEKLATIKYPEEPFECLAVATGFMLIQMEVFKKLPRPWFFFKPSSDSEGMVGEDIWFCRLARKHGIEIWCDPTIQMTHVGTAFY